MHLLKKNRLAGMVLSFLLLITVINSCFFFVATLKLSPGKWLAFNACSIASIVYLVCFTSHLVTKRYFLLAFPLLPMYYYGTMGLFLMPWNAANLFVQVTHGVITLNLLWALYEILKARSYEALGKASLAAMLVFVPVFAYLQHFLQLHSDEFMQALQHMKSF